MLNSYLWLGATTAWNSANIFPSLQKVLDSAGQNLDQHLTNVESNSQIPEMKVPPLVGREDCNET